MPPYLGQGACSGIRDAANIAWKLNLVLTGRASVDLLDTYEAERRPHVTSLMKTAVKLGKVANTHSRLVAALRNVAFRLKLVPPPPPFPSLSAGVIERGRQGPAGLQIGRVPPQSQVRVNGRLGRLDDYVGYNFALISVTNPHNILSQVETSFLENLGCRILTLSDDADANVARIEEAGGSYLDYLRVMERSRCLRGPIRISSASPANPQICRDW
ncbi:FAD-dependent monooxygenase [Bradyrhizobium sp. RDM4]|uniref:FAD-dependent monooxygenase n=1 Tax=Bradyrhizobium sp. RDM4 TaxID=3378765 RepID=UPI0038FC8B7F